MRARDLLRLLAQRLRLPEVAASAPPMSFPTDADRAAIAWLAERSFETGQRQERARAAAIMSMPQVQQFPRLASDLLVAGVGAERAGEVLATAAAVQARLSTSFFPTSEWLH